MGILNPVVSKFALTAAGGAQEVYFCPAGKSHAVLDLTVFKNGFTGSSVIGVALTTESNPAALTSLNFLVDDIELVNEVNSAELNKLIVGQGERVYVKVMSGSDINVRLSGVEENNASVLKAGKLAAASIAGTAQTKVYENLLAGAGYVSGSLTIYNSDALNTAEVQVWITSGAAPAASDKLVNIKVTPKDTTIMENLLLSPNEKIFVQSNQANTEYFLTGMCVSS